MSFDFKRFKNSETKKHFVSNNLKIIKGEEAFVILEDELEQTWNISYIHFINFIIKNNITIENNILKDYLIIDRYNQICKPIIYDQWLDEINKIEYINKKDLKVGYVYLLESQEEVIFLGSYYIGSFDIYCVDDNPIECKNIYKKDVFFKKNSLNNEYLRDKDFKVSNKELIVKELSNPIDLEKVNKFLLIYKTKNLFYYFSKYKFSETEKKIKLNKISENGIFELYNLGVLNFTIFKKIGDIYFVIFSKRFSNNFQKSEYFYRYLRHFLTINNSSFIYFDKNLKANIKKNLILENKITFDMDNLDCEYYMLNHEF